MSGPPSKNTSFRTTLKNLVGGIIIGAILMCAVYFFKLTCDSKFATHREEGIPSLVQTKFDTMQTGKYTFIVKARNEIQIKEQNEIIDEKIKSINDRTGDLYLSLTIIVTLLLVFNIGVFYNASHDAKIKVEEYLADHIGDYESKARSMHDKLQKEYDDTMIMIQGLATEYASLIEMKKQTPTNQAGQPNQANE